MNALKHMELIFGAALALAFVLAFLPRDPALPARSDAARAGIPVVVVTGKRMTALEKRQAAGAGTETRPAGTGS
jgi:hypothetical protein